MFEVLVLPENKKKTLYCIGYRRPSTLSYGGTAISCGEIEPLQR